MKFLTALSPKQRPTARQKLRAAVARRVARTPSIEEEEEPTTSFTTAFIVVVLLHVVFVGGVYMFDSIQSHRSSHRESITESASDKAKKTAPEAAVSGNVAAVAHPKASAAPVSSPAAEQKKPVTAAAAMPAAEVKDSGQSYTVAKGDTLVTISKKLHVVYDDICKLNKIEDPKKLRIGQKLRVPLKARPSN